MKLQLSIARKLSLPVFTNIEIKDFLNENRGTDEIVIDAIFGIGLTREVTGKYADWIQWLNQTEHTIFSVDIPSGIDATTGRVLGVAVKADYTVTFGVNKLGLVLFPGTLYAGKVAVEEIGFPKNVIEKTAGNLLSYEKKDMLACFPKRIPYGHKGNYGKLLLLAGSETISGAAFFAAKAAYRMGCGLVHIVSHENNRAMLQTNIPEALYTFYNNSGSSVSKTSKVLEELQEIIKKVSAVVIGPGIGQSDFAKKLLYTVLKEKEQLPDLPVLIDADGLNLLSGMEEYFGADRSIQLPSSYVLTPHLKEMSRLVQLPVSEIRENLLSTAKEKTKGAVLVLKDARTLITNGEKTVINQSGNSALSKGGSGDVLSGMAGGLLARGTDPFTAAALAVYLHGCAAEEYIKYRSSSSMLASELLEILPKILP